MKMLITGGAGFIGSHLAEKFIGMKREVTVIDNLSTGRLSNIEGLTQNKKFKYHIDDMLNIELMDDLVRKNDVIVHLAAAVGVKYIIDFLTFTYITVSDHVFNVARGYDCNAFIRIDTVKIKSRKVFHSTRIKSRNLVVILIGSDVGTCG